jgi:hypothetical protein
MEVSKFEIPFLDTLVKKHGSKLITDLYSKPTDSFDYLLYDSSHPQTCKDSIPYSQFLRVRRICSRLSDYERHVIEMSRHFLRRLYPIELLEEAAVLARRQDRELLLNKQGSPKDNKDNVFLITTYHPTDTSVVDTVRDNWDLLGKSPTTQFIHNKKLICGYRRPKNLRDFLVRAAIPFREGDGVCDPNFHPPCTEEQESVVEEVLAPGMMVQTKIHDLFAKQDRSEGAVEPLPSTSGVGTTQSTHSGPGKVGTSSKERGFNFCNRNFCRYCPKLNKSGVITSNVTNQTFDCMKKISCRSSNLVYAVSCMKCGKQYVGQTLLRVKDRFSKHFLDVEKGDKSKAVGLHFSQKDHNGILDMKISVLEFIKKPPRSPEAAIIRDRVEKRWIHLLRCPAPQGLNIFD